MDLSALFFLFLLGLISFLYASVGHGGASGYLALMALFGFAPEFMKPTALTLNILVSFIAFLYYRNSGQMKWRLFLTLIIASIPAAYLGGKFEVDAKIYKQLLGLFLLFPVVRLFGFLKIEEQSKTTFNIGLAMFLGLVIGFVSGLIGIGGGILLSPLLLVLGWSNLKETSTISALFITVNSIAGLVGASKLGLEIDIKFFLLVVVALICGSFGAYLGAKKFNNNTLRILLASVLLMASIKLLVS